MRLEDQAKRFALAVQYYSETYSKEPSETLRLPVFRIMAAYHLAAFAQNEKAERREGRAPVERMEYSQQGSERNAKGECPERLHETSIVPLTNLAGNEPLQTDLMDMVNRYKE